MIKKVENLLLVTLLFLCLSPTLAAQESTLTDPDSAFKETLYKKYKKEAQAFDKKEFDVLFFEFSKNKRTPTVP